jgi:hypothetical protein|tara:strand:- start:1978 stop:2208 length:231 start_codon:yes stop_codon:yes gene_type:complete
MMPDEGLDFMFVALVVDHLVYAKDQMDLDRITLHVNNAEDLNKETLDMLRDLWMARKRHLERIKTDESANALGQGS